MPGVAAAAGAGDRALGDAICSPETPAPEEAPAPLRLPPCSLFLFGARWRSGITSSRCELSLAFTTVRGSASVTPHAGEPCIVLPWTVARGVPAETVGWEAADCWARCCASARDWFAQLSTGFICTAHLPFTANSIERAGSKQKNRSQTSQCTVAAGAHSIAAN